MQNLCHVPLEDQNSFYAFIKLEEKYGEPANESRDFNSKSIEINIIWSA